MKRYSVRYDGYRAHVMERRDDGRWWDYCQVETAGYLERADKIASLLNGDDSPVKVFTQAGAS